MSKLRFLYHPTFWAVFLGTLPLSMLLLTVVPSSGFVLYLRFSHLYHSLPKWLFGSELFPTREFGTLADGAGAQVLAMGLYTLIGYIVGVGVRRVRRAHHQPE